MAPAGFTIQDFSRIPEKQRAHIASQVTKLERRTFPSDQRFDYDVELRKKNVGLKLILWADGTNTGAVTGTGTGTKQSSESVNVVGYLVYQRIKSVAWLHKLVVAPSERRRGLGRMLMGALLEQVGKGGGGGCEGVQLWVDESNAAARALYEGCGFRGVEKREGYYGAGEGRGGIRMVWEPT